MKQTNKVLIIGCGGIGSWLTGEIAEAVKQGQIAPTVEFHIADNDMVEIKQIKYQNFSEDDIGENKAEALSKRYSEFAVIRPLKDRIAKEKQLKGYDLIICCADNNPTRELLFRFCHKNGVEFIDLRAEGRYVMAFQKTSLKADLKTLDLADKTNGSCQKQADIERGWIQYGNRIVSVIGLQMLINYLREQDNPRVLMRI